MDSNITIVLEGLPALGKTTLTNLLETSGFEVVHESLGELSPIHLTGNQLDIFNETKQKYANAASHPKSVIDRGYPSLLAWDYCAEQLGYAKNLTEKSQWVNQAFKEQVLYEPTFYIYLSGTPELSLSRRPRPESEKNVWSTREGLMHCLDYYEQFFEQEHIKKRTLIVIADQPLEIMFSQVKELLESSPYVV